MNQYQHIVERLGGHYIHKGFEERTPVGETEIKKVEAELGFSLPEEYAEFFTEYSGYTFFDAKFKFDVEGVSKEEGVNIFFGFELGTYDICRIYKSDSANHAIPPNLLPIADDSGGNQIYIGIAGEESGQIFYWALYDMTPQDFSTVRFVSKSFSEFMNSL